jgi:nucleotide-binding universal stress UspA family protein
METQDPHSGAPIVAAFSPASADRGPLEFAHAASRVTGAPLIVVSVRHGGPLVHHVAGEVPEGDDDRTLQHLREGLDRRGLRDVEIRVFEDRTAAGGLERAIEELEPELVVLGASERGAVGSAVLGNTVDRVIHESSCPVAVVPHGYERPEGGVQLIGAAFTPTAEGREALHAAATLARAGGAKLRALTVLDPEHAAEQTDALMAAQHHDTHSSEIESARHRLATEAELRESVAALDPPVEVDVDILVNKAADGLVAASEQLDLLVMGSRALGPRRAVVLGSVSRKVAERSACPVLVLPRGATAKTEALLADAVARAAAR